MSQKERTALAIQYAKAFLFGTDVKTKFRIVGALLVLTIVFIPQPVFELTDNSADKTGPSFQR